MGRKVFAPCTRTTGGSHSLHPLSSLLVSVAVCLVGLVACLDLVHGSHHHHSRGAGVESSDRLCSFTPKEEREYAAARYESARPDGDGLQKFLREWRRDVREEDTVRFQPIRMIGSGSQGSVVEAKDLVTRKMVAIKQVKHAFASGLHAVNGHRVLQELVLLRLMNSSDHTISILHAFLPNDEDKDNFTNVYFVMEHMDVALQAKRKESRILKLPAESQKKMMFNVLSALDEMHQAGIYHRDIAGWNIMGNFDCSFKVIDLGMASSHVAAKAPGFRRYDKPRGPSAAHRPPEFIYQTDQHWTPRGDIWLTGCTFLRLIVGRHNICDDSPARAKHNAFASMVNVVGMPSNDTLSKYGTKAREFFESLRPHSPLSAGGLAAEYSGRANQELLGLVQKMVVLDPESRPSAAELLQDPVFAGLRNSSQISKDNQQLVAESASKSLEILKGSKDAKHNRKVMYEEILKNYEHPSK